MLPLLQPSGSQGGDSGGEASKSIKRRISFTPDVSKGKWKLICTGPVQPLVVANVFSVIDY